MKGAANWGGLFVRLGVKYREREQLVKDQPADEGGIDGHPADILSFPRPDMAVNIAHFSK
jgi:hypothetical protein